MFSEEGNFENHDIFFTARCENVYIADCAIVGNVLANTDNKENMVVSFGAGVFHQCLGKGELQRV